ncbi:ABC transporter permease, partial [Streptomyces sp. NPDC057638]
MTAISLRTLRHHKNGFIASFIALFLGSAIVIGCAGLFETGLRTAAPPERLSGAPIVLTGDQHYPGTRRDMFPERIRLDDALRERVAAVPGVEAAVPDISFSGAIAVNGPGGSAGADRAAAEVTGHGWSSVRLSGHRILAG